MFTADRINRLLINYGFEKMEPHYLSRTGTLDRDNNFNTWNPKPGHRLMDTLDGIAKIETGGTLGERVLRHEEQLTWRRFFR